MFSFTSFMDWILSFYKPHYKPQSSKLTFINHLNGDKIFKKKKKRCSSLSQVALLKIFSLENMNSVTKDHVFSLDKSIKRGK